MNGIKPFAAERLNMHPPCAVCGNTVLIYNNKGLTWVELIVVLLFMGILSAVIVSTMTTRDNELMAEIVAIKSHLRYAQSRAMSTSSNWYVQFDAAPDPDIYSLYKAGEGVRVFPSESSTTLSLLDGLTISGASPAVVLFDYLGRPYTDSGATTPQAGVRTLITSTRGNIEIYPETGFIP